MSGYVKIQRFAYSNHTEVEVALNEREFSIGPYVLRFQNAD